ncbi:MAG: MASE3 domain-containing protein [Desulfobacula sp.]|jgi:PAS domain S-box-containing protein
MSDIKRSNILNSIGGITAVIIGFYLSSLYSYLLFHAIIEIITIAIAFTLFILVRNTSGYSKNNYLSLLGIGYAFIAVIDLLHTIAYKGMNVFPGYGANLPTQLWIAARYLQAVTLLAAPLLMERRVNNRVIAGIYTITISVFVMLVYSGRFPDCFIEGAGLTAFKINSEYVITVLLVISIYFLFHIRKYFNGTVFSLIVSSVICTALSELSFTAYVSVYGFSNMLGHFAKLAAFFLIYRAILVTGIKYPFELIFRDVKQAEEKLRKSQDSLEQKVRERTAELQASEEKYCSLIRKVQAAIILHDGQGNLLDSNPLAQELLGLSSDQLLGKALIDPGWHFLRGDGSVLPVTEYPISQVLSTRQPLKGYVAGISRPDRDDVAWVLVNAEPEYDEAGKITLIIVSFVDITERKRTEEALQVREKRLLEAQQLAHIGNWELDLCTNTLLWSDEIYRIFEISKDTFGASYDAFLDLVHPDDREKVNRTYTDSIKNHIPYQVEHRLMMADGRVKYMHECCETYYDSSGLPIRSVGTVQDITERRQAQEALRRIEWMLSKKHTSVEEGQANGQEGYGDLTALNRDGLILKSVGRDVLKSIAADYLDLLGTSSAIYEANGDYVFGIFTSSWCRMMDRASRKLCNTDDNATALNSGQWLCHESCWTRCSKEAIATCGPIDIECSGGIRLYAVPIIAGETVIGSINFGYGDIPKDPVKLRELADAYHLNYEDLLAEYNTYDSRPPYIVEMAKSRLHASARLIGILVERRQAEEEIRKLNQDLERRVVERTAQLEAKNKELQAFSYSVSHDLRGPLRSIDGFSQVLCEEYHDKIDVKGREYLQRVRLAAQYMAQLIDDLLNLSRVSLEAMAFQPVNLSGMVREIAAELQKAQPERRVEFVIHDGITVQGDSRLLRIVLENLIRNAWKFTSKHPTARIEFGMQTQNETPVYFVRDDGAGFDMTYIGKLFGAFQRLHTANEFPGTGIGLATVQRIIHRHEGKVWAEGETENLPAGKAGGGATFYFTIK